MFNGEKIGSGVDNEPLVIPDMKSVHWFRWDDVVRSLSPKEWIKSQFPHWGKIDKDDVIRFFEIDEGKLSVDEWKQLFKEEFGSDADEIDTILSKLLPNPSRSPEVGGQYQLRKQTDPPVSRDPKILNTYLKDETDAIVQTIMNKLHPKSMSWLETMLKSPEWFDHPQIQNIVKLFMRDRNELYHETFNELNLVDDINSPEGTVTDAAKALRNKAVGSKS